MENHYKSSKSIWVFLFIALLAGNESVAQTGLQIGFFGMPQNTWIFNNQEIDSERSSFTYQTTWGYAGMVKVGYNFVDPLGVHVGAVYSVQGQKSTSADSLGGIHPSERSLTYLKIPLLLHMSSEPGPVMLNMEIGPQIALLREAHHFDDGVESVFPFDASELYHSIDWELTWAIGAQFNLTDWVSFVLVHRGDYGIFDMEDKAFRFNGERFFQSDRQKSNNACFGIMGGFNFSINPQGGGRGTNLFWR